MTTREINSNDINKQVKDFIKGFKTGILTSMDLEGKPYLSVLPIIKENHTFYAYISRTAPHYKHLKNNLIAQILFAEDEAIMASSFLRKRVSFDIEGLFIETDDGVLERMKNVHGAIIDTLKTLDFELIQFQIKQGKAIFGAGQAYFLDNNEEFTTQDIGQHKHK